MSEQLVVSGVSSGANPALPEHEDAALVQASKRDCRAFSGLYTRYYARVLSYVRLRTDTPEDAADLTHQVFLKALDALPRYRDKGVPFSAWLMKIARNTSIDASRKRRSIAIPEPNQATFPAPDAADPEVAILERERLERLRNALALLSQDKRDLLALRFTAGLSSREIGQVVGKSEAAVMKQLTRTLNALREELIHEEAQ